MLPIDYTNAITTIAREKGIGSHLDGARLFNAVIYLNEPIQKLTDPFDSVQVCLSKGLAAPVGSILAGSAEFIKKARKYRKMLGGGMRQAGVLAAAGLIAITQMVHRLGEDHQKTLLIGRRLHDIDQLIIDLDSIQTNMIYVNLKGINSQELYAELRSMNILIDCVDRHTIRLVLHKDIAASDLDMMVHKFRVAIGKLVTIRGEQGYGL